MAGLLSIGWYVPQGRRHVAALARDYGVSEDSVRAFSLRAHAVAGEADHPSTMGAQACSAALSAAKLNIDDIDYLIFAGMTRDYPAPWVGAFGVLHELQASHTGGFDLSNRCTGLHDALWVATQMVKGGSVKRVLVCAADRFDHLLGPPRKPAQISDLAYSAGAAAAVIGDGANNEIVAFSHLTNPDLSLHQQFCPLVGGSRQPVDAAGLEQGLYQWQNNMRLSQASALVAYMQQADRHNLEEIRRKAGFDEIDFIACSPLDVKSQLASLAALGIGPEKTLLTLPLLGHMGPADSLVALGLALATGRRLGNRVVLSTRSALYSNALAVRACGPNLDCPTDGFGLDIAEWRELERRRLSDLV